MLLSKSSSSASSSSPKSFDRALGFIISLAGGASLYLLHAWLKSLRYRKRQQRNLESNNISLSEEKKTKPFDNVNSDIKIDPAVKSQKIWYDGSCHCGRFHFRVFAPEELCAVEYGSFSAKNIRFPRLTLPACDFHIMSGTDDSTLSLYSVVDNYSQVPGQVGVHAFCSFCGMQVLYSPPPPTLSIHQNMTKNNWGGEVVVNVDCLEKNDKLNVHVAYGGTRDMPSFVSKPHSQTHNLQNQQLSRRYSHSLPTNYQSQPPVQHGDEILVKQRADAAISHCSDSSTTRDPTASSEEDEYERGFPRDNTLNRESVNLFQHLNHEGENENFERPYAQSTQHVQYQSQVWENGHGLLSSNLLKQDESVQVIQNARSHRGERHVSNAQLGHSPSLYDTLPLMYNIASTVNSTNSSPHQQFNSHLHYPPQYNHDAPVMIRGSDLMGRIDLGQRGTMEELNNEHGPTSLHQRLKRYLQQHMNEDDREGA